MSEVTSANVSARNRLVLFAKGLGIAGVVAHHIGNRRFEVDQREWISLLGGITDWAVPLFILLSGYLYGLSRSKKSWGGFCGARFMRLIVPFILISLIYSLVFDSLLKAGLFDGSAGYRPWYSTWYSSLTGGPGGIGEQLYFFPVLFLVTILSSLILKSESGVGKSGLWGCVLVVFAIACGGRWTEIIYYWSPSYYLAGIALFMAGFLLARSDKPALKTCFFVAALITVAGIIFSDIIVINFSYPLVLFSGILLVMPSSPLLEFWGEASGTIYVYHTPFLIQPLVILIAVKTPQLFHIAGAYGAMFGLIVGLSFVHRWLSNSRFKRLAF